MHRKLLALGLLTLATGCASLSAQHPGTASMTPAPGRPLIIAHRGASGLRPEHTLAAYDLAITQGADLIEPDLVITKDGVLIARHENEIGGTTDVATRPEFAHRRTTKTVDGRAVTGWFSEDFTLAEIKTLRAVERIPDVRPANAAYDGRFEVPAFQEVIDLARFRSAELGRPIGIYPETKHPSYFAAIGLPFDQRLVDQLHAGGYRGPHAPVFIQSFEPGILQRLRQLTDLPLVMLLSSGGRPTDFAATGDARTYADLATPAGLAWIASFAHAVGPIKTLIVPLDAAGRRLPPTSFVTDAHAAGLQVHPWTFRDEDSFLPADLHGDPEAEYEPFLRLGVDALFTDFPATALAARRRFAR
jgi:glycerophosphoryl diester phosphodiesterase